MTTLTPSDFRHLLQAEAAGLSRIDPSFFNYDVPHLEGWTVRSVIGHTGWVLRFADLALQADPSDPPSRSSVPEPPHGDEVIEWFKEGSAAIQSRFDAVDPDSMRPTFTGPQPASWWLRRLSHEVSMHRWDAESATGSPSPIDPRQARDGVEEVLQVFVPQRMQFDALAGSGETVHLHATDLDDGEWLLTYRPDSVEWTHGHIKGDVAAKGTMSDLLLLLWGRLPTSRIDTFGDASLLERWQKAATF